METAAPEPKATPPMGKRGSLFHTTGSPSSPDGSPSEPRAAPTRLVLLVGLGVGIAQFTARILLARHLSPAASVSQLWRASEDAAALWSGWTGVWLVLAALLPPRRERLTRWTFLASTALVAACESLDMAFTHVTGNRVDLDAVEALVTSAEQTLPVVLSEARPSYVVGALLGLGAFAMLARWRPRAPVSRRPLLAWLALLALVPIHAVFLPSPKARGALSALRPTVFTQLAYDWRMRGADIELPPDPSELAPVTIRPRGDAPAPNVVMVLLESTGARHTSVHDPSLPTTPTLARLAREGLAVRNLYAVVPHTSKALVSVLCGQMPVLRSRIAEAEVGGMPGRCLAELLAEQGYRTGFFQTAPQGFEQRFALVRNLGFDHFRAAETMPREPYEKVNYFGREDKAMLGPGLEWSRREPGRPFLATYLTLTSHHRYGTPKDWPAVNAPPNDPRSGKAAVTAVDDAARHLTAVNYVDHFVDELIKGYERLGLADNTLFVIVGDHGEAFGEHGRQQHDLVVYDEGLHVPAVLYGPGMLAGRSGWVEGVRSQLDLMPTLLELIGMPVTSGHLPGKSLFTPPDEARTLLHSCWRAFRCLAGRQGTRKWIDFYGEQHDELYDVATDPLERDPLRPNDRSMQETFRTARARVNGRAAAMRAASLERAWTDDTGAPAAVVWEDGMELLDCEAAPSAMAGDGVWLTCRWRATTPLQSHWELVARVKQGRRSWTTEHIPLDGAAPAWTWMAGRVLEDRFRVRVPAAASAGAATVTLSWRAQGAREVPTLTGSLNGLQPVEPGATEVEVARVQIQTPPLGADLVPEVASGPTAEGGDP